jgi:sugar fermentation stimulation protein A
MSMRFFGPLEKAGFVSRPNRFLIRCRMSGREITAFLPNPGRLQELLFSDSLLYLSREPVSETRKYPYTVVAVEREGLPIMLHTHKTNTVAEYLIDQGRLPGLENARVIRREVTIGHSRFDFLLDQGGEELVLEVKSCTLVGRHTAMFPDAVSARASRHLEELAALSREGRKGAVLFLIHWPRVENFKPDYHTDLHFARTMLACRDQVRFLPVSVSWQEDLSLGTGLKRLPIPWDIIEREARDRGNYLLLLKLPEGRKISVGKLGGIPFRPGYYVYVGSAMANLSARMERHRRLRKTLHWHIDFLRAEAEFQAVLPIRSSSSLECRLAQDLKNISEWSYPRFGSSDCDCPSHLFGFETNPFHSRNFMAIVQHFRMDRLDQ